VWQYSDDDPLMLMGALNARDMEKSQILRVKRNIYCYLADKGWIKTITQIQTYTQTHNKQ